MRLTNNCTLEVVEILPTLWGVSQLLAIYGVQHDHQDAIRYYARGNLFLQPLIRRANQHADSRRILRLPLVPAFDVFQKLIRPRYVRR